MAPALCSITYCYVRPLIYIAFASQQSLNIPCVSLLFMNYAALVLALLFIAACAESPSKNLAEQLRSEKSDFLEPVPSLADVKNTTENIDSQSQNTTLQIPAANVSVTPEVVVVPAVPPIPQTPPVQVIPATNDSDNEAFFNTTVDIAHTPSRAPLYFFLDLFTKKVDSYQFAYKSNYYAPKGTKYRGVLSH